MDKTNRIWRFNYHMLTLIILGVQAWTLPNRPEFMTPVVGMMIASTIAFVASLPDLES